jgi:hypothetical protein
MNKSRLAILPLAATLLAACGGNPTSISSNIISSTKSETSSSDGSVSSSEGSTTSETSTSSETTSVAPYDVKWVTPTGSPTLAFYNQGNNANWVSSSSPATVVLPAFATNSYDAIVFDGLTGLNVIKKNSSHYKLATWLTGGSFYIVSTKHTVSDAFDASYTIDGFVKTGNAAQAFLKLAKDNWAWAYNDANITWEAGVADVKTHLVTDNTAYDYYLVAEPVLTAAKAALAAKSVTLNVIYNLQTEWAKYYKQTTIPAAGLFINSTSYADASKKAAIDTFLADTQTRIATALSTPADVKTALDAYGSETEQSNRFGFTGTLANALQSNGANKFALLKDSDIADRKAFANDFASAIGSSVSFDDTYFL